MAIIDILKARDLFYDASNPEAINALKPGERFYVGIDPSASSLQLGNLVPLIVAAHLAKAGLKPIILFGGATGSIGDPSGKSEERQLQDLDTISANVRTQTAQVRALFSRLNLDVEFVNNFDWTAPIPVLDFLRDIGKHFTVNYMLAKEHVKTRLAGEGISYTEFSYMLLQAMDFCHLYQTKNCKLQLGGSDQWGNITAGAELIRKKLGKEAYCLSFPLMLDGRGRKFGKSAEGALWLDSQKTSAYKLHQFLINTEDAMVVPLLKVLTFLELSEITELEKQIKTSPEKRNAQKRLADQVVQLVHGPDALEEAKKSAAVLFDGDLSGLSQDQLLQIFGDVPSSACSIAELSAMTVSDLFAKIGLVKSKAEAKKLIQAGGAYVNNKRVAEIHTRVMEFGSEKSEFFLLRSGKKSYHLVKISK